MKSFEKEKLLLGNKIKKHREESGLSQEKFAKKIGISQSVLSRIEMGEYKNLNFDKLLLFSQELGTSIEGLFTNTRAKLENQPSHLIEVLPDDEFLRSKSRNRFFEQLIEKPQYFYCFSTLSADRIVRNLHENILKGILYFNHSSEDENSVCYTKLEIESDNGRVITYEGQTWISLSMDSCTSCLISKDYHDTITLSWKYKVPQPNDLNRKTIVAVLTTSAEDNQHHPIFLKGIISKTKLSKNELKTYIGYMKMSTENILISKTNLESETMKELMISNKNFNQYKRIDTIISDLKNKGNAEMFYTIKEKDLKEIGLDDELINELIGILRRNSQDEPFYKVSEKAVRFLENI